MASNGKTNRKKSRNKQAFICIPFGNSNEMDWRQLYTKCVWIGSKGMNSGGVSGYKREVSKRNVCTHYSDGWICCFFRNTGCVQIGAPTRRSCRSNKNRKIFSDEQKRNLNGLHQKFFRFFVSWTCCVQKFRFSRQRQARWKKWIII